MKKLVYAAAVLINVGVLTFAQIKQPTPYIDHLTADVVLNSFEVVELSDLSEKVQAAITSYRSTYLIKLLEYNEGQKQTRVTLEEQETKVEKIILLNDEGKEI